MEQIKVITAILLVLIFEATNGQQAPDSIKTRRLDEVVIQSEKIDDVNCLHVLVSATLPTNNTSPNGRSFTRAPVSGLRTEEVFRFLLE